MNKLNEIKDKVDYLYTHNKNYTNKQYDLINEIKEALDDITHNDLVSMINEDDETLAWKIWTYDDVLNELPTHDIEPTDQNLLMVLNNCNIKSLESNLKDCTEGDWLAIDDAIYEAKKSLPEGTFEPFYAEGDVIYG